MSTKTESQSLIVKIVESSIDELATHFLKNPYFFYTENDIQCHLFNIIFQKFEANELNKPIKTSDRCSSILLHKEYPTKAKYRKNKKTGELNIVKSGTRGHFDICVWNPELVSKKLFRYEEELDGQSPFIAGELVLVENNYHAQTALNHTKRDLKKLSDKINNVEHGFLLIFVRNWENSEEFKKLAKEQLILEDKPKSLYIEISKETKLKASLRNLITKP